MIATTLEQSRKLVEIGIDPNTADMHYAFTMIGGGAFHEMIDRSAILLPGRENNKYHYQPAWSLAALLELIPSDLGSKTLTIEKCDSEPLKYGLNYHDTWGREDDIQTKYYDNLVDTCYEMIIKLHEQNLL